MQKMKYGIYADCYVLTNNRTRNFVDKFLETFIPKRKEQADVYEVPQYGKETEKEFDSADNLIQYLELNSNIAHTIYWKNLEGEEPRFASCFFTDDNNLIVGLSCNADDKTEDELLMGLMNYCGTDIGYITYEQPAPQNSREFMKNARSTNAQHKL